MKMKYDTKKILQRIDKEESEKKRLMRCLELNTDYLSIFTLGLEKVR